MCLQPGATREPWLGVLGPRDAESMAVHLQSLGREERAFRLANPSAAPERIQAAVQQMLTAGLCYGIREPGSGRFIYLGQCVPSDRPGGVELAFSASPDARGGLTLLALAWLLPRLAFDRVQFVELRYNPFNPAMDALVTRLQWRRETTGDGTRAVFQVPQTPVALSAQVQAWRAMAAVSPRARL